MQDTNDVLQKVKELLRELPKDSGYIFCGMGDRVDTFYTGLRGHFNDLLLMSAILNKSILERHEELIRKEILN